jgi:hypothetical protein
MPVDSVSVHVYIGGVVAFMCKVVCIPTRERKPTVAAHG